MSDRRGHNIAPARLSAAFAVSGQTRTGWTAVDFGTGTELLRALDVTADGEVVLGGKWGNYPIVARLLADGTLDTSFHEDGKLTVSAGVSVEINDLLVEPDGRIVLGGLSVPGPGINFCLMIGRLNADGTTDTSFGVNGWRQVDTDATEWADERVLALARQADGKIIAAGYTQAGELTLARLSGLTRHYAMQDANWNLTGIVDPATGQAVERYVFTPYGGRTVLDSAFESRATSSFGWIVGHQGLAVDAETGLIYNRARYLDTSMGRFTIRDPLGYVDGMSVYQYARARPTVGVDPSGLLFTSWGGHCGACTGTERCCRRWQYLWEYLGYGSSGDCITATMAAIGPTAGRASIMAILNAILQKAAALKNPKAPSAGYAAGAGIAIVAVGGLLQISKSFCWTSICIDDRKADSICYPRFKCLSGRKCTCMGDYVGFATIGTMRTPVIGISGLPLKYPSGTPTGAI